jgi:hypothetical protein
MPKISVFSELEEIMIIDRRTLIFGATATCSGFVFRPAQASVLLDLSKVEYGLPKIKGYLIDCTTSKGLKFPHGAAAALANATDAFADKQAPNEPEVVDWLIGTLTSAGASPGDARGFADCVRSVADIYGTVVEEFIKSTFGDAVIRTDDGKEIKTLLPKNLRFRDNTAFKVE